MFAADLGREVLEFVVVLRVGTVAGRRAAAVEGAGDLNFRRDGRGIGLIRRAEILEARFIHGGAVDGGEDALHGVEDDLRVVAARNEIEAADAGVGNIGVGPEVAE